MSFAFTKTTPATGAQAMYEFKERLKTQGWTVPESSDGTTYNGAGDQITAGGTGAGGMANDYAWFRIQHPSGAGFDEFSIQRGTTNLIWRIKHSRVSGFVTGSPDAVTVSAASDEAILYGGGTDAAPTFTTVFATDNTYRWNVGADSSSPYGWWAGAFPTGGGDPTTAIVFEALAGYEPTDAYLHAIYIANLNPFLASGLSTETFSATNKFWSLKAAASPTVYTNFTAMVFWAVSPAAQAVPDGLPTNPITVYDEVFPIPLARRSALGDPGWKGLTTLMKWTGTSRTTGDTLSVLATRDRIVYGNVSLPWDGTVPTV
jgi:hypothetical protein